MERGLGYELQRVGLLLSHRWRFRGNVDALGAVVSARSGRCSLAGCQDFMRSAPASGDRRPGSSGAVFGGIREGRDWCVAGWPRPLRLAIHPSPAADDALDVLGGAGPPDGQQPLFGLGLATRVRHEPWQRGKARATRSCLRRCPVGTPGSHSAQERKPVFQPARASKSWMRSSRWEDAASRCADSSAISSPIRSGRRSKRWLPEYPWESPSIGATLHRGF